MITEKVPHEISNYVRNTSVNELNSTFRIIRIENIKKYLEDMLCIAKLSYNKMVENGLWTVHSNIQDSSFVVNAIC